MYLIPNQIVFILILYTEYKSLFYKSLILVWHTYLKIYVEKIFFSISYTASRA